MELPITSVTTVVLAIWYVGLIARVVDARRAAGVSIGTGDDLRLARRMRGQANFVETVPISLLVMAVAESQTVSFMPEVFTAALTLTAIAFTVGRLLHGYAFCFLDDWGKGRMWGMLLTFGAMITLIILAILALLL